MSTFTIIDKGMGLRTFLVTGCCISVTNSTALFTTALALLIEVIFQQAAARPAATWGALYLYVAVRKNRSVIAVYYLMTDIKCPARGSKYRRYRLVGFVHAVVFGDCNATAWLTMMGCLVLSGEQRLMKLMILVQLCAWPFFSFVVLHDSLAGGLRYLSLPGQDCEAGVGVYMSVCLSGPSLPLQYSKSAEQRPEGFQRLPGLCKTCCEIRSTAIEWCERYWKDIEIVFLFLNKDPLFTRPFHFAVICAR